MKNTISLFDDAVEYYQNSGLSKDGKHIVPGGNYKYIARQAAIDLQRKYWNHETQFMQYGSDEVESNDRDPEDLRFADEAEVGLLNSAAAEPNSEELVSFNETVRKMVAVLEASEQEFDTKENMVKMFFLKVRRANVEHFLEPDLLKKSLAACGDAAPTTNFEEAEAVGFSDCNRGKSHSNKYDRTSFLLRETLKKSELAA